MRKIIFILLFLFSFLFNYYSSVVAQSGWYWVNPLPQGNTLLKVKFINSNTGFSISNPGTLLTTTNGGLNWQVSQITTLKLYSIFFLNSQTGYISASKGTLFKTTNAGINWTTITSNISNNDFYDVFFMNENTGFTVYNSYINKTTNGGTSWNSQSVGGIIWLQSIFFINNNTGFTVGDDIFIFKTTNAGQNWTQQNNSLGSGDKTIAFADSMHGFVTDSYGILNSSTDGGVTWFQSYNVPSSNLYDISFANQNTGSICGHTSNGSIFHTTNGGTNWIIQSALHDNLYGVNHLSPTMIFSVGEYGKIYKTTNEGISWDTLSKGYSQNLNRLFFIDSLTGWAAGNQILKTIDGGEHWVQQKSSIYPSINDLYFINGNIGFGIGEGPQLVIFRTNNGGTNWSYSNISSINGYFLGLYALSQDTLFFVGKNTSETAGFIYRSVNGGNSWTQMSYTGPPLNCITFINSNTGFCGGKYGTLMYTSDSGLNWSSVQYGTSGYLVRILFANSNTGWAMDSYPNIIKTTNGGTNWFIISTNMNRIQGFSFFDQNIGMAIGPGLSTDSNRTYYTSNGGENWTYIPIISSNNMTDIKLISSQTVIAIGIGGTIIRSNTHGYSLPGPPILISPYNNQNYVSLKPNLDWSDVSLIDSYTVQISTSASFDTLVLNSTVPPVSNLQLSSCVLYRNKTYYWRVRGTNIAGTGQWSQVFSFATSQSYNGWNLQDCPDTLSNNSVFMIDSLTGWIAGNNGKILKTTSSGDCWSLQSSNSDRNLNSLYFIGSSAGWAVGDSGTVIRTINGGNIWTNISPPVTDKFNSVCFTSLDSGWITGNNGKLYKTINSGLNWNQITIETSFNLNSIKFINQLTGWICGDGGTVYKTTNYGLNWFLLTTNTSTNLSSIAFVNDSTGWTVGQNGLILKSNNGGDNWFTQNSHVTVNLNSVFFSSPDRGWITADSGKLIATKTAGSDWKVQNTFSQKRIRSVSFTDINIGWICGSGGIIYYTKSGSIITFVKTNTYEISDKYILSQNYPNPFNPLTKIKFNLAQHTPYPLSRGEMVILKVYDLLGREISTLVSEKLNSGTYEVTFDGGNLPSGIYLYKLQAGNFIETKKMVLLK